MDSSTSVSPPAPHVRLALGITGHRAGHAGFAENEARIVGVLGSILDHLEAAVEQARDPAGLLQMGSIRLHTLLADGTDRIAAQMALARSYQLVAPLPFGRRLNRTINSLTNDPADARRLLAGEDALDPQIQAHAAAIRDLSDKGRVFQLADADDRIAALFLAKLDAPDDQAKAQLFAAECSRRVALAGRILIEQSDLLIAVWDGNSTASVGGTGHTIATALELGVPVVWIDPANPEGWQLYLAPEGLVAQHRQADLSRRVAALIAMAHAALRPGAEQGQSSFAALDAEKWRPRSNRLAHAYRRVEALFGGGGFRQGFRSLTQRYEGPDEIAGGSAAPFLNHAASLPGASKAFVDDVANNVLRRFAWSDGISARLSDAYRGGMIVNFVLSSLAILAGISYLPMVGIEQKWLFAGAELLLLMGVLAITAIGQRRDFHTRWFATRRLAEYLRHAPLLLIVGAARPAGRWPNGADSNWPEFYARQALRGVGLPRMVIGEDYLRGVLTGPLADHVRSQRDYHFGKAARLTTVHHKLDHLSERLFQLAVASVTIYLMLTGFESAGWVSEALVTKLSKYFTVAGVMFPTFGAGIAGVRYFGDFERFGEISSVTATKLDAISRRIDLLAHAPTGTLNYGEVAELVHATDDVVVAEIESWQAVFAGKHITVPV
jgi:hypothetical protein